MDAKIFVPNDEQFTQMMEDAWQKFLREAKANDTIFKGISEGPSILKDLFVYGYVTGYNDIYGIIRSQMELINNKPINN